MPLCFVIILGDFFLLALLLCRCVCVKRCSVSHLAYKSKNYRRRTLYWLLSFSFHPPTLSREREDSLDFIALFVFIVVCFCFWYSRNDFSLSLPRAPAPSLFGSAVWNSVFFFIFTHLFICVFCLWKYVENSLFIFYFVIFCNNHKVSPALFTHKTPVVNSIRIPIDFYLLHIYPEAHTHSHMWSYQWIPVNISHLRLLTLRILSHRVCAFVPFFFLSVFLRFVILV